MMLYTEQNVRDNIRNREGKRVFYLRSSDQLTSGARDFLRRERIEILPAEQAKPDCYRLENGAYLTEKPEHMTHLNGNVLVCKTHPRIAFRGKMDLLEAELMLCQLKVPAFSKELQEILQFARYLLRCEVLDEQVSERKLCGLSEQELRQRSHMPQDYYGQPHFMPEHTDGEEILLLNRARCIARQAELAAVAAFTDEKGNPTRKDLLRMLNRLSSMLYILMIRLKAQA
ncbi:MAG: ATP-binding protein [Oscillospiraceae bacterium]|nr:ATP-binding protein [Oscillospiraceae bacterium]